MVRYIFILILSLFIFGGVFYYLSYDENYYKVCESLQKHDNFKQLTVEEQFQTYLKYNCKFDSMSARGQWAGYIGSKEGSIEFLLNKLRNESDEEILAHALYILRAAVSQQEIKSRCDIINLVKQTVDKIQDIDERNLSMILFGSKRMSRKERLQQIAIEIEEQTKMSKAEYQAKMEKERNEKIKNEMEKLVREINEKAKQAQSNSK